MSVRSSSGSPTTSAPTAAARRGAKSSQTARATIIRLADMHSWPELAKPPRAAAAAAASRSAPGSTIMASLPEPSGM